MSLHQRLLNSPQELTEFLETQGFHDLPDEEVITLGKSNLLIHAAYLGQFQVVNTLLSHADLRAVAENGGNVVDWLCFRSDTTADCLASVLQKWTKKFGESDMKSMLNSTRMKQGTPLMCAVFAPNVAVTQLLLRSAADVGSSALDLAAQTGGRRGQRLVALLLEAMANPNVGAIGPLFLAVQENDETSVRTLLLARARPGGLPNGADTTPVECAARFGFLGVLKLLLAADGAPRGSDLSAALKLAHEQGHMDVERILIKSGAADDIKLSEKRRAETMDRDAQLLPSGFRAGTDEVPSFAEPKPESEKGKIRVEEVDGSYKLYFQGGDSMTATAILPVRLCPAHPHFYFEVVVEEMDLLIAVGFARNAETPQQSLPGWTPGTYGLHSDDGLLQANTSATRVMPGWKVKAGSTVGMGVEWNELQDEYRLFVTLDGQRQPREVPLAEDARDSFDLWPLVGADRNAALRVNFGAAAFAYREARTEEMLKARQAAKKAR